MTPKIYGHRGSRTRRPENTMPSLRLAIEEGADGLEIDIRTTADGEIVISHDSNLKRCGGIDFSISTHTWKELSCLPVHCPDLFGDQFINSAYVPRLEELFAWMQSNDCLLNIEIKVQPDREYGYIEEATLKLIAQYGLESRIFFSSFDEYILVKLKELEPAAKTALLHTFPIFNAGAHAEKLGCFALHPSVNAAEQYDDLRKCCARGMDCNIWTVNDTQAALRLAEKGATGIITDLPLEMVQALRG